MYSYISEPGCRHGKTSCSNPSNHNQPCYSNHGIIIDETDIRENSYEDLKPFIGDHPVEIHEENVINIDLPPLMWFGYNKIPKILSVTNTGRTILVSGQWTCGRPYITGGPLNGSYIFSQIHFHSPSEHVIDGRRYPLEMHVVHYKNSYLTQERAMNEKDGTMVLVYLFQLIECGATVVSQISKLAQSLEKVNTRRELVKIPLDQFARPFNSNYYMYRGSVPTDKNCYLLQFIISCNNLCVTKQEIEELLSVTSVFDSTSHLTLMKPENDIIYRVGEDDYSGWIVATQTTENPCCCEEKEVVSKSNINVCVVHSSTSTTSLQHQYTSLKSECQHKLPLVHACTNTSPCSSNLELPRRERREHRRDHRRRKSLDPKDRTICISKVSSRSNEKCTTKTADTQTSLVKACTSRESSCDRKARKSLTERECSKTKMKKSSGDVKEKSVESSSKTSHKVVSSSNTSVVCDSKTSDKITTIYEKKHKGKGKEHSSVKKKKTVEINTEETKCTQTVEECFPSIVEAEDCETLQSSECGTNATETADDTCKEKEVQINYLFIPNSSSSNHSHVEDVESDAPEVKNDQSTCIAEGSDSRTEGGRGSRSVIKYAPQLILNDTLANANKLPYPKPEKPKEIYLHTKHVFRSDGSNKGFSPSNFQECHMLIERDHEVLKEYSGYVSHNQLSVGSYEKINILPRKQSSEDLRIQLAECVAKLDSPQELSIRVKFLLSEPNMTQGGASKLLAEQQEVPLKKDKCFSDAENQCFTPLTTSIAVDTKFLEEEHKIRFSCLDSKSKKGAVDNLVKALNIPLEEEGNSKNKSEDEGTIKQSMGERSNGPITLLRNPGYLATESTTFSKEWIIAKNENEEGAKTEEDKGARKTGKTPPEKRRKAVYFVYDRIEKDESTGKKIFVGSFRTRDEVEVLYKSKDGSQNNKMSCDFMDNIESNKQYLRVENEEREKNWEKRIKFDDFKGGSKKVESKVETIPEKSNEESVKKELITLHKFQPKQYQVKPTDNKFRNLIIGKISSKVGPESEKYGQLADMLGLDKTRNPKISFYEFQQSENGIESCSSLEKDNKEERKDEGKDGIITIKPASKSEENKVFASSSERSAQEEDAGGCDGLETIYPKEKELSQAEKRDSQPAIVIIPIQVDSLSKIEIVLIEHNDDVKKKKENEYNPYIKHYERFTKLTFL